MARRPFLFALALFPHPAGAEVLDRAAVAACVSLLEEIAAAEGEIMQAEAGMAAGLRAQADLRLEMATLAQTARVDPTTRRAYLEARAGYKAADAARRAAEARLSAAAEARAGAAASFDATCDGRPYRPEDRAAVEEGEG